jgi:hypothetical protein
VVAPVGSDKSGQLIAGCSVPDPFHILEQNLLTTAVVEFGSTTIGVPGNTLGGFERAIILQKIGDTACPERVGRIVSRL